MASYQSSFDPPPRPDNGQRRMKPGTYIQPPSSVNRATVSARKDHKEVGSAHIPGQMEAQQIIPKGYGRQTGLPKPRVPPPTPETVITGKATSSFGFRRPAAPASTSSTTPVIKSKNSRNVLRRKPSSIAQHVSSPTPDPKIVMTTPSDASSMNSDRPVGVYSGSGYDLNIDNRQPTLPDVENSNPVIPELDRYRSITDQRNHMPSKFSADIPPKLATQDLPPPTPLNSGMSGHSRYSGYSGNSGYSAYSAYSASPSTRYSESPGPGAYSRDTTPTSMSSQSPSVVVPLRMTPRLRQNSPVNSRPPLTRRRAGSVPNEGEGPNVDVHGLPSLRESLTSSSSNSTVKENEKAGRNGKEKDKKKKKRLSPMPPSPPPRKSSQKFKKSPSEEDEASPSKASKAPAQSVMVPQATTLPPKASASKPAPSTSKIHPPTRPSREGTPNLEAQLGEIRPVIQSNLALLHFSHDRRQSNIAIPAAQPSSSQTQASPHPTLSKIPSRTLPPSPSQQQPSVPSGLGIIPDLRPIPDQSHQQRQIAPSPTPSPSPATPKHRFGIFSRRAKTDSEAVKTTQKEATTRKGPAAGTGHEGYGRYAHRGRGGSTGGSRDRSHSAASSSQESISSTRTHDPFLLERMSPVIIVGGGEAIQYGNNSLEIPRSESSQSLPITRPSLDSKTSMSQGSVRSNLNKEVSRTTLWPSAMPRTGVNDSLASLTSKGAYTSESSDNESFLTKPSLAVRRSMHRLQSTAQEPLRIPKPLRVLDGGSSPATSSQATSVKSDEQTIGSRKVLGTGTKKLSKRPRSPRKWNPFQRSQPAVVPTPQVDAVLPVVISRAPTKPVPYYAMMDSSEQEEDAPMDMEDILREAEVADLSHLRAVSPASSSKIIQTKEAKKSDESLPIMQPPSPPDRARPQLVASTDFATTEIAKPVETHDDRKPQVQGRPSRLLQVGRIPRVVTARPDQISPKSFSRPFARVSMIQPVPKLAAIDRQSIAAGPTPERSPSPTDTSQPTNKDQKLEAEASEQQKAFLVMSPRKNSEATTSSSSGALSFVGTTAVVPDADAALEEDEVWGEYDDLLGHEEVKVPESATSSHGVPFQYESFESRAARREKGQAKEPSTSDTVPIVVEQSKGRALPRMELTSSSVYSPDLGTTIRNALHGLPSPTTPMSFTDFISGYGDRNNSVIYGSGGAKRLSSPPSQRNSQPHSTHSRAGSMSERARQSAELKLRTISENAHDSPIAQVNLRVGSMTVSKWLTFGHVLFSPARDEILSAEDPAKHHSVLVIDGLGNDDWAFYAAETYPTATFYNLSPTPSNDGKSTQNTSLPQAPNNHRQVQYNNTLDKFPFPRDTFEAVVLRFPPASSDAVFRNLIAEGKRVLKPAGYLEMSILDLDMMNMGNRARRAVRGLKVKISVADPSISLASAADTVLRIVGKRGFHDIKSCKVGVPVASTVTAGSKVVGGSDGEEKDISLAEMMKDESSVGDAGITKMVARVGRWWYLRCYELATLPDGDISRSIFTDTALLRECEKWNTSFKLMVCHAQKPFVPRRRTASV